MKNSLLLKIYRSLPFFKGKLRLGKLLFRKVLAIKEPVEFTAHYNIHYKLPNTEENLGLELLINGIYEKNVVDFLKNKITNGDVYFDIGANIGSIGLPIVKKKPKVHYFGFEASPSTFEYLEYNFQHNNISHFELHNYLIHEDDKHEMKFYQSNYYGKSSLAPTYSDKYVTVKSVSLTTFCNRNNVLEINWMKIDVQGFELYVFKGMGELLINKRVKNILFEFEYWAEDEAKLERGAAQKYLTSVGYEMFAMNGKKITGIITKGSCMIWAKPRL